MQSNYPYIQYMYSYPHKTAYETLRDVDLKTYLKELLGKENSLYFHIPFCQYKCGYCNLFSVAGQQESIMTAYVDALERQATQLAQAIPENAVFNDLTLGGGTPLLLPEHLLRRVFQIAKTYFKFAAFSEEETKVVSLENEKIPIIVETSPNQTTKEKLAILKEMGVTRVSIGVQSFQQEELERLHRFHKVETAKKALHLLKEANFSCVNVDLIYGIPGQTKESLLDSLKQAVAFAPEELFVYPLYVKPGTYLYQQEAELSKDTYEMYQCVREHLAKAGYEPCSMRRFVKTAGKKTVAEKPFEKSSLCGFGNTLSIGCGGRSYLGNLHFCTPYAVQQNHCLSIINEYIAQTDFMQVTNGFILSKEEEMRRYVIRHILFGKGICREDYRKHFKEEAEQDFSQLQDWIEKGYAVITKEAITLTKEGFGLSDYLGPQLISDDVAKRMKQWREKDGTN